nr:MAG: hypothetical protein DIU78_20850 [Pseudomonadota bacterium]
MSPLAGTPAGIASLDAPPCVPLVLPPLPASTDGAVAPPAPVELGGVSPERDVPCASPPFDGTVGRSLVECEVDSAISSPHPKATTAHTQYRANPMNPPRARDALRPRGNTRVPRADHWLSVTRKDGHTTGVLSLRRGSPTRRWRDGTKE